MKIEDLKKYGATDELISILSNYNISELYPPQAEAVKEGLLQKNTSLVISAPTASGKTLIAEMAMLKNVLTRQGKVIYLVPLRALAQEKYEDFREKYKALGIKVNQSTGDFDNQDLWLKDSDIIISTNEKVDSLIRHRASWLNEVTLIIADEIHLIGDSHRGTTLEIVLVRLKSLNPRMRFIALSATIPNAIEIANWLGAEAIESEWRPVPLKEGIYYGGTVFFKDGSMRWVEERTKNDAANLVIDTMMEGGQALVFVSTRKSTEGMAHRIANEIAESLSPEEKEYLHDASEEVLKATTEPTRICKKLSECLNQGVAFHHAGLHYKQRKIVEDSFRKNKIKALVSTTTLAMGLNLPSRRVIIKDWYRYSSGYGMRPIPIMEIKQMSGRAGRPKYDNYGEALIIASDKKDEKYLFENYLRGIPEWIESQLGTESSLRTHILSSIAGFFARTEGELQEFMGQTFFAYQRRTVTLSNLINNILLFLSREGMIEMKKTEIDTRTRTSLLTTPFGQRVSQLYIDPLTGVILRDGLMLAEKDNLMESLSLLHLITATPDMLNLALNRKDMDKMNLMLNQNLEKLLIYNEYSVNDTLSQLKTTCALLDWINEETEDHIVSHYNVGPGDIYNMVELSNWLLYSSKELCQVFGLKKVSRELTDLRKRVTYGVKEELLPLISLEGIGRVRGRELYNAGFRTLKDIKNAKLEDLQQVPTIGKSVAESIKKQVDNSK